MTDLVVQGPLLSPLAAAELQLLTGSTGLTNPCPGAWRLTDVQTQAGVAEFCSGLRLDFAFLEFRRRLTDFRVLALDMDSTLITIECIDEIADMVGVKPQVAAITEAAMRGDLDFPGALRRRVALLAGLEETALQRVYEERLRLSPGAETLLAAAQAAGLKTVLVSGGFTYFTERLQARLGLDYTLANVLEVEHGRLTGHVVGPIVDADAKAEKVAAVCAELGCNTDRAIVLGDGANDLKMMKLAGLSVAYRAKPVVQRQAIVAFNHVGLDGVLALLS
jgi:phosphoserine phosphatase